MKYKVKLTLFDIFKFSNGQICLICDAEPANHRIITSDYVAKIVIQNIMERQLNIIGQDIFSRSKITERNSKTVIRTEDKIDDFLKYLGKKAIEIYAYLPEDVDD